MGREVISGEDFYATVVDMGEEVEFLTEPPIYGYASIAPHRTTNTTDGAYWYRGVMTFENTEQQNELIGEYFKRQTNKTPVHILTSVMPENTTDKIAEVYAVECNDKVDIISHYEKSEPDKYGATQQIPIYLAQNVDCYITVTQKPLSEQKAGAFIETVTNLLIPAKFMLAIENVVVKKGFVFDDETKTNIYTDIKYQVESVDTSMMDAIEKEIEVEIEPKPDERKIEKETNDNNNETAEKTEGPDIPDKPQIEIKKITKFVGILRCTITEDKR